MVFINPDPSQYKGDNRPVESVSWNEAKLFVQLMSFFGRRDYRLPSEAEWEYAARAGTTTARYWGERVEDGCAYEKMADLTLKTSIPDAPVTNCTDQHFNTAPVGSFKPNQYGLYDMLGNVAEWVDDCYVDNYWNAPKNGSPVTTAECKTRVVRGGSWFSNPRFVRAAARGHVAPDYTSYNKFGFRVRRAIAP